MNILIIDTAGNALDWALRCKGYGHTIKWYCRKTKEGLYNKVGTGLIDRVPHWEPHMKWADLIFLTDNTYYIHDLEEYRKKGFPIFGCNKEASRWELERQYGQKIFEKAGIETIPTTEFKSYDEAIAFVKKRGGRWVSKPTGDADKALSYVAKNPADMIFMLQRWKKKNSLKHGFILQEFVPGIEVAVGGWVGDNGFSKYFNENFEFKKLMNDDLGVATGEQGTVMRYTKESKLADKVLKPLEDYLIGIGYTGYIDVNCMVDKSGTPLPMEFSCRPGWPHFQIVQPLHRGDPAKWMTDLLDGIDSFKPSTDICVGVVVAQPDYPYSRLTKKEVSGMPLYGVDGNPNLENIHLCEVMMGEAPYMDGDKVKEGPHLVSAGDYLFVGTGTGKTVEEAKDKAYKVVKSVEIPNSVMYRTDIGCRLEEQLPKLQAMGYATGIDYE